VSYTATTEEWQGEWFEVAKTTGGNTDSPVISTGGPVITIPNDAGMGAGLQTIGTGLDVATAIAINETNTVVSPGTVTTINVLNQFAGDTIVEGQQLTIWNPVTNTTTYVTVQADVQEGDDTIAVTGVADEGIPEGSLIFLNQSQFFQNTYMASAPMLVEKLGTDAPSGISVTTRQTGKGLPILTVTGSNIKVQIPATARVVSMCIAIDTSYVATYFGQLDAGLEVIQDGYNKLMGMQVAVVTYNGVDGTYRPVPDVVPNITAMGAGWCAMRLRMNESVREESFLFVTIN
jgi:hypothetical protein